MSLRRSKALLAKGASQTASRACEWSTPRSSPRASRRCMRWPPSTLRKAASSTPRRWSKRSFAPARPLASSSCPGPNCWAPRRGNDGVELRTERETIVASQVVNAAGTVRRRSLADGRRRTRSRSIRAAANTPSSFPAKRSLVNSLVYPPPLASGHGLGVHLLKTVDGSVWLGPTAKYQARKDDYDSDRLPVEAFVEPARRLLKSVDRRRHAHRRQRHPRQAAPARGVVRGFHDSAGS